MTDKQLAILLSQYHNQLSKIHDTLNDAISEIDGVERLPEYRYKYIGEGKEPVTMFKWEVLNTNYELVTENTGGLVLLEDLSFFVDTLEEDIKRLNDE